MDELEKFFKCPYCFQKISMLLDVSVESEQTYIEDCEVCCRPIQIQYFSANGKINSFSASKAYD